MSSIARPPVYTIRLSGTNTLTADTSLQPIFDSVGTGSLTLPVAVYFFHAHVTVTNMNATSGNALIDWQGAGTANVTDWLWHAIGADGVLSAAGTMSGSFNVAKASPASIVTAAVNTVLGVSCWGSFRVTTAGTIIPSIQLVTGNAAVVSIGSYFRVEPWASSAVQTVGPFS